MIKKWLMINLVASLVVLGLSSPGMAKKVTREEALTVAKNWITLVLHTQKKWGESKTAHVEDIQEFKRKGKVLGYFCKVRPRGFIVISSHRRLAPVKAYSETSGLDPAAEKGLADFLKTKMERHLGRMEAKAGRLEAARDEDLEGVLELDHRDAWRDLESSPSGFENLIRLQQVTTVSSPILLSTSWHQAAPYNDHCPMGKLYFSPFPEPCILKPDYGLHNTNAPAGCVAIAGAQVMKYWAWPAWRRFPWRDILERYDWSVSALWFHGPDGRPITDTQRVAVATLVREVGDRVDMSYDCHGSSAHLSSYPGPDLLDALEDDFRYSTSAEDRDRNDYSISEWWSIIKANINMNWPMPYSNEGHAFVCDGWREVHSGGQVSVRQYHMNWGHDSDKNAWYSLEGGLPNDPDKEKLIEMLQPDASMPFLITDELVPWSWDRWRYFPHNTQAENVTFAPGQTLQFHHNIKIWGNVDFWGTRTPDLKTWMFSGGVDYNNGDKLTGIAILDGRVGIRNGGAIRFPLPATVAPPHDNIGVFADGDSTWFLDTSGNGHFENWIDTVIENFGRPGDMAVVGDWSGSGSKKIGVKAGTDWFLDYDGNGSYDGFAVDRRYTAGAADDIPVAGDWNGDGKDEIGTFNGGKWFLDYNGDGVLSDCTTDLCLTFGSPGEIPVVGDWNGDGRVKIGTFSEGVWYLDYDGNHTWSGPPNDRVYTFGMAGDLPVVGDWSGNGIVKIGVTRIGGIDNREMLWYLDYDGNGSWGDCFSDRCYTFGQIGNRPISGKW